MTLLGQVTRPTLKSDAENVVKGIEGVEKVINEIEVLPPSPMDDRIRRATYRAIYGRPPLDRYALSAVPSIHIIVSSGKVTLTGVADNETDKNIAGLKANGVSGVFSVDKPTPGSAEREEVAARIIQSVAAFAHSAFLPTKSFASVVFALS